MKGKNPALSLCMIVKNEADRREGPLLQINIDELSKKDPDLALRLQNTNPSQNIDIVFSRGGLPVSRVEKITLHSLIDPEKEARDWADRVDISTDPQAARGIAVFGFGTGYHIKALLDRGCRSVVVIEPRLDVLRAAFEWIDFSASMSRMTWVVDPEKIAHPDIYILLRHQPSVRLNRNVFSLWEKEIHLSGRPHETMRDLIESFRNDEEIGSFLKIFPPDEPANLARIAKKIFSEGSPLRDWQVIFLLMNEFKKP